jgi:hypothetical protein
VKFFEASEDLKGLYEKINTHARLERERKREELVSLNERSQSLLRDASTMDHGFDSYRNRHHYWTCEKCQLERQAGSLTISVHEWPLPSLMLQAYQVVFELSPPRAFSLWRDITYMILRDIGLLSVEDLPDRPYVLLHTFSGLSQWATQDKRITIGSTTKSFADQSHYKTVAIPAEASSVLVNNGLQFQLYDNTRGSWAILSLSKSSIAYLCIPPVPMLSPYSGLHRFVTGTHTPNDIIANQADCPKEINLHEFLAFSGLRSGPRLQWLNIARELASATLTFRVEEVHTLVTQAAWQLGPLLGGVRDWHVDLCNSSFGNTLLNELEFLLQKIKANWQEEVSIRTIGM